MIVDSRIVLLLRVFLGVLLAVLLLLQVMSFPGQFAHMAEQSPERASLQWPLTALAIFLVGCVQAVVIATWNLLTLVRDDRIFSSASRVWVNVILWAIVAATSVVVAVFLLVGFSADDPGAPLLLFSIAVILSVASLLMVVMRALLRRATEQRSDLDGVI